MEFDRNVMQPETRHIQNQPPQAPYNLPSLQHVDGVQSLPISSPQHQIYAPSHINQVAPMSVARPQAYNAPTISAAATTTTTTSTGGCTPLVAFIAIFVILGIGGIIAGVVIAVNNSDSSCSGYTCPASRQCIPSTFVCDNIFDCSQNEDESDCSSTTTAVTAENSFTCPGSSTQILKTKLCDEVEDCPGGADEDRCVTAPDGGSGGDVRVYSVATNSHHRFCGYTDGWTNAKSDTVCQLLGYSGSATNSEETALGESGIASDGEFVLKDIVLRNTVYCSGNKFMRITCTSSSVSCGTSTKGRIVGGADATIEEHPWQVGLLKDSSHICGGTIISERWIVSAAHCFTDGSPVATYQALAGTASLLAASSSLLYNIDKIVNHPLYNDETNFMDIAVLHVTRDFSYSATIQPACLPTSGQTFADAINAVASGWGSISFEGPYPNTLQAVTIPVYTTASCRTTFPYVANSILDGMICAGLQEGGKDSCQGDSGGPLAVELNSVYYLAGATSFGSGCALPNYPGVYAEISYVRDWIDREMEKGA